MGTGSAYKGITDEAESKTVKVYVTTTDGSNPIVQAITVGNTDNGNSEEAKLASQVFTASYTTKTLTLTKKVAGNQADVNDSFPFDLTLGGAAGEEYNWKVMNGTTKVESGKGSKIGIQLKDGWTVTVEGLSDTDTYKIKETNNGGYDSTNYKVNDGQATNGKEVSGTLNYGAAAADSEDVVFTNTKNGTIPTGILMSAAPYVGLVGLGGIFAGLFFRRKRED